MIKVNKPIDIILNEATHNEHVSYFIDCVNEFLSSQDKFPLNGFRFSILMDDMLTKRELSLITFVLMSFGWNASISYYINDGKYDYKVFLIESKKVYL